MGLGGLLRCLRLGGDARLVVPRHDLSPEDFKLPLHVLRRTGGSGDELCGARFDVSVYEAPHVLGGGPKAENSS